MHEAGDSIADRPELEPPLGDLRRHVLLEVAPAFEAYHGLVDTLGPAWPPLTLPCVVELCDKRAKLVEFVEAGLTWGHRCGVVVEVQSSEQVPEA